MMSHSEWNCIHGQVDQNSSCDGDQNSSCDASQCTPRTVPITYYPPPQMSLSTQCDPYSVLHGGWHQQQFTSYHGGQDIFLAASV